MDLSSAGRPRRERDLVVVVGVRRLHDGVPLCFTTVTLPPAVEMLLEDVAELRTRGATSRHTVLGLLDARLEHPVLEAEQSITVDALPVPAAGCLGLTAGQPVLRIDRMYSDARRRPVELAVSWFHPDHFAYRVRFRRSDH